MGRGQKVAAIGIKVSKWIYYTRFCPECVSDLSGFDRIVPCGIRDRGVVSMAQFIPDIDPQLVRSQIIRAFVMFLGLLPSATRRIY